MKVFPCFYERGLLTAVCAISGTLAFSSTVLAQTPPDPLGVGLVQCEPWVGGTSGDGIGNDPADRQIYVRYGLYTKNIADDAGAAADRIERIEICSAADDGMGGVVEDCPGTAPWLIFDRTGGVGTIDETLIAAGPAAAGGTDEPVALVPFDFGDPANVAKVLFLKVVDDTAPASMTVTEVNDHGGCVVYKEIATAAGGQISVFSGNPDTDPFGGAPDACEALKVNFVTNGLQTPAGSAAHQCLPPDVADYLGDALNSIFGLQFSRLQSKLLVSDMADPTNERKNASLNGSGPFRMFVGSWTGGGNAADGWARIGSGNYAAVPVLDGMGNPNDPNAALMGGAADFFRIFPHELFHTLQGKWNAAHPSGSAFFWTWPWLEQFPHAGVYHGCLLGFPGAPAGDCISGARHAGASAPSVSQYADRMHDPSSPLFLQVGMYSSGGFWHYLYSQYSFPVGSSAHPTGTASNFPRPADGDTASLSTRTQSDHGFDLLGLLFKQFANAPAGTNIFDAADPLLQAELGREAWDTLFDYHTAIYLKDYVEIDDRWKLDYASDKGHLETELVSDAKPFDIAPASDKTCGRTPGGVQVCDGLRRTKRQYDLVDYATATMDLLPIDGAKTGVAPMAPFGANAVSVGVDPAVWGGQTLRMRLSTFEASKPRLRLFRVDGGTPVPLCGTSPEFECTFTANADNDQLVLNSLVAIGPNTTEILAIGGTDSNPASFDFVASKIDVDLQLVEPSQALVAQIGHPTGERRSFMIKLGAFDEDGQPVAFDRDDLSVEVTGCAAASCTLTLDENTPFVALTGGYYFIGATLPADFYPAATAGTLGLSVTAAGATGAATCSSCLAYDAAPFKQTTAFVLDRSGSMADFGKLDTLKVVSKAIVASLLPPAGESPTNRVGIVSFDEDADTTYAFDWASSGTLAAMEAAIDGLTPGTTTSIGDGLFEAQSNLAFDFDSNTADPTGSDAMIVLSDGLNNEDFVPFDYYGRPRTESEWWANTANDGRGTPWYTAGNIIYGLRADAGERVPTLSTIALGQDADVTTLDELSRLSSNRTIYAPLSEASAPASAFALTTLSPAEEIMSAMTSAMDSAYGQAGKYQRLTAARLNVTSSGAPVPAGQLQNAEVLYIPVEPGVSELRVVVTSSTDAAGWLARPSGSQVSPTTIKSWPTPTLSYRVRDPEAGLWRFDSQAPTGTDPTMTAIASVRGRFQLFTFADVEGLQKNGPTPDTRADVLIRAVPMEGEFVPGCSITGSVVSPDGAAYGVTLQDAGDGVYSTRFHNTAVAGQYDVALTVDCISPVSGAAVHREERTGFALAACEDLDADNMCDEWELTYGLDPTDPNDGTLDSDEDELTNEEEHENGTDPTDSDTDHGGESDGSEVTSGSDPRDRTDDDMSRCVVHAIPGDEQVAVTPGCSVDSTLVLVVQRGPSEVGPWSAVPAAAYDPVTGLVIDTGLTNGTPTCYRTRLEGPNGVSPWSVPFCVVPGSDSVAPHVQSLAVANECEFDDVQLTINAGDDLYDAALPEIGMKPSGVTEMRVWTGPGGPDSVSWQPFSSPVSVDTPGDGTVISVQVRDAAGNVSATESTFARCSRSCGTAAADPRCPSADAGPDVVLECAGGGTAPHTLDGSGSNPEPLSYRWDTTVELADADTAEPYGDFPLGSTDVTLVVENDMSGDSDTVQIVVLDQTAPVITPPPPVTLLDCGPQNIGTPTIDDACGSSVTVVNDAPATFPLGSTTVTWFAVDAYGNESTATQVVTVEAGSAECCSDTTAPTLLAPPDAIVSSCLDTVNLGTAVAYDACTESVIVTNDAPADFQVGQTLVTWQAIDALGNTTTRVQVVVVGLGGNASCCPTDSNVILGTSNKDTLVGTAGDDCILGFGAQDVIYGLGGNDIISAGDGDDIVYGGAGADVIHGGTGQDQLYGEGGDDFVSGDDGVDVIKGGDGNDLLRGGQGQDTIYGEAGNDALHGEADDDTLYGGSGDDRHNGGGLHDQCIDTVGSNTFTQCENQPETPTCDDGVQNGSETGVDCGGSCPLPCSVACEPALYEAELIDHSTGGWSPPGWNIWSNGYVSTFHTFEEAGPASLTVVAKGQAAWGVWPRMVVTVGGVVVGNIDVTSSSYQPYEFTFDAVAGVHDIRVSFVNDYYGGGQDRNLYVDAFSVECE